MRMVAAALDTNRVAASVLEQEQVERLGDVQSELERTKDEARSAEEELSRETDRKQEWEEKARKLTRELNAAQDNLAREQSKAKAAIKLGDKGRNDSRAREKELRKVYFEREQLQENVLQLEENCNNYERCESPPHPFDILCRDCVLTCWLQQPSKSCVKLWMSLKRTSKQNSGMSTNAMTKLLV